MKFYLKKPGKESPKTATKPHLIIGKIYDAQFDKPECCFVYSTGEKIIPREWIQPKRVKGEKSAPSGYPKKNPALQGRLHDIAKEVNSFMVQNRRSLSNKTLKAHLDSLWPKAKWVEPVPETPTKTLISLWADYLQSINGTINPRTFNSYSNSFETSHIPGRNKKRKGVNFREFLKSKAWENIMPEEFTATHYNYYHSYLKSRVKPNTVAKRLKHLKQFLSYLVDDLRVPVGMNLNKITYRETSGLKLSLSEEELQAYIDADLPEHLVKVRDLAVLQCATGLRISDRQRIDKNIRGNKIVIEAQKTRSKMEIPITTPVRLILEKYNYELPYISEQNYRAGIKAIHQKLYPSQKVQVREGSGYKDVFVWEEISSHDMVRTFISLSAQRGMKLPYIASITGKSMATLLKNYLVVSQEEAEKSMEKAWGSSPLKVAR